jgi:hypothetical protein
MTGGIGLGWMREGIRLRGEDWLVGQDAKRGGVLVVVIAILLFSVVRRCLF